MRARRGTAVAAALLVAGALSACTPDGAAPPAPKASATTGPAQVTLAVYGPDPVISAYTTLAASFSAKHDTIAVNVKPYRTHAAAMRALATTVGTSSAPDIFLAGASDLDSLEAEHANTRVDQLLSERNIDFGDGYERAGLEAFSDNDALQCMPVDMSPLVVYYNASLVHLAKLRPPGEPAPSSDTGWGFEDFVTAAHQASRGGARGVYVAPEIRQIAPFVLSGGGKVVDDTEEPTSLQLSDGASQSALRQLLQLVRDPQVTFSSQQLAEKDALTRFEQGRLGMLLGFRDLTPELRKHDGLTFGVMPIPRLIHTDTVADVSGLCMRPKVENRDAVGDFLAFLVGDDASRVLAATGYVTPANSDALHSDDFLQPTLQPNGSNVFIDEMRYINELPRSPVWNKVEKAIAHRLYRLFYAPVIDPLEARLAAIDARSKMILAPPSASPSGSPTG